MAGYKGVLMITRENLKQIVMLTYLTDDMLDELIPITELLQYDEKEYVFHQGDKADRYYSIHGRHHAH